MLDALHIARLAAVADARAAMREFSTLSSRDPKAGEVLARRDAALARHAKACADITAITGKPPVAA